MSTVAKSRPRVAATALAALVVTVAGCRATVLTPGPADRLREENARLESSIAALELEVEELRRKLAAAKPAPTPGEADAEARAAAPHLAGIEISAASVIEADAAGRGTLWLRLVPRDGRGRFLQITGRVSVRASVLAEGSPPAIVGEGNYSPLEVRDAWRSGFGGSLYLFEVPIEFRDGPPSSREATVLATFRDAIGGGTYSRLALVPIDVEESPSKDDSP